MKLVRAVSALLLVLCAGLAGALVGAAPAHAGGWAATVLDPVPATFEPGKSYTIGFWVLQHGSHPFEGKLDPVGLRLTGPNGTVTFPGTSLPEPAHFATSIVVPTAGEYTITGVQGVFETFRVGTITVPGALTVLPVPPPTKYPAEQLPWKEIRPPEVPVDPNRGPIDDVAALPVQPATTPAQGPAQEAATERTASQSMRPTTTVLAALAATGLVLGLLLVRRRRAADAPHVPDPSPRCLRNEAGVRLHVRSS